ncbi:MAG: carbonic anhydrase [Aquihabitans sp.]
MAADGLRVLIEGNRRFVDGDMLVHSVSPAMRIQHLQVQEPIAVVLGCVDSRVPPEVVLDQGVGDILTVRTAGQALSGVALGSLEFGVRALGVPLMVVLGHTNCGAVLAAIEGENITGYLGELIGEVAVRLVDLVGDDPVKATGGNLQATVDTLRALGSLEYEGHDAYVVGVLYDMASGKITVEDDAGLLSD